MIQAGELHDSVFDDEAFVGLMGTITSSHDARSFLVNFIHDKAGAFNFTHSHFSPAFMRQYEADFITEDPWLVAAMRVDKINKIFNASEDVSKKRFETSRIYNDLIRVHGDDTYHCAGGAFKTRWGFGVASIQRGKAALPFTDEEVHLLEQDISTIRHVLMVKGEIAAQKRQGDIVRSAMDVVGTPAIVLRRDLTIAFANQAAEDVLREGSGLTSRSGRIVARKHDDEQRLTRAVELATASFQSRASTLTVGRYTSSDHRPLPPYQLTVTPLAGPGHALLLFRDPAVTDLSLVDRLRAIYRLTVAEAELAVSLSRGLSLTEIAASRSVQESTIRSQMKSIAGKMGCSRQSQIVMLVTGLPPLRNM